ncbi:uncharacterized protein N7483_005429 [Penicillium malachiteum]|uniref:uncharacterized protein n=1 Tax=Penicillium malachiteum TaxID=1324776 RepID=UPI002547B753|nr:uncharacterized protein N7483_005429 [Penicillium malachiteum]KAJ5730921.1 hypothetical protein N7483_005429 [Penicillium malachiteum]
MNPAPQNLNLVKTGMSPKPVTHNLEGIVLNLPSLPNNLIISAKDLDLRKENPNPPPKPTTRAPSPPLPPKPWLIPRTNPTAISREEFLRLSADEAERAWEARVASQTALPSDEEVVMTGALLVEGLENREEDGSKDAH